MAASPTTQDNTVQRVSSRASESVPNTMEQLEVGTSESESPEVVYPSGLKLWFAMASLCIAIFLTGLVCSPGICILPMHA